jgi:hypothetical protein
VLFVLVCHDLAGVPSMDLRAMTEVCPMLIQPICFKLLARVTIYVWEVMKVDDEFSSEMAQSKNQRVALIEPREWFQIL